MARTRTSRRTVDQATSICLLEALEGRCLLSASLLAAAAGARPVWMASPKYFDDYGNTFDSAYSVAMASDGSASVAGKIDAAGDVDVFAITATQTGTLTVSMTATAARQGVDSYLRLYDSARKLVAENDDSGGTLNSSTTIDVTAGTVYYIQASAYGRSVGAYSVRMTTASSTPSPTPTPTPTPTSVVLPGADDYSAGVTVAGQVLSTSAGDILVLCGTDGSDSLTVSESGATITVVANGSTMTFADSDGSAFEGLAVYGFDGADTLTVTYSVSSSTSIVLYAGAGDDTIYENSPAAAVVHGQAGSDLLVTVGGGADQLYGETGADSFWLDSSDTLRDVDSAETAAKSVHRITSFVQPTRSTSQVVSLEVAGQNIVDPTSSYAYSNAFASSPLFADGVQYNDILQGSLGDCYFLAGLSGLAQSDASLVQQSITALGDGTYAVRFYRGSTECYYRIDAQLPTGGSAPAYAGLTRNGSELWVALLEKAFAQFRYGQNSYASIEGGSMDEAYTAITGMSYTSYRSGSLTATALAQRIQTDLAAGHAVTAGSTTTNNPIVGNHAYEIRSVEYDTTTSTRYITVYNPWGVDGASWDSNSADGLLRLTAAQFKARFDMIEVSAA